MRIGRADGCHRRCLLANWVIGCQLPLFDFERNLPRFPLRGGFQFHSPPVSTAQYAGFVRLSSTDTIVSASSPPPGFASTVLKRRRRPFFKEANPLRSLERCSVGLRRSG